MIIVMAGLPGSGKSTVAEAIAAELSLPLVSVDPIESAILSAGIAPEQPTGLAAYLVAETIADRVLDAAGPGVVIDAVNAVAAAREQWMRLAARHTGRVVRVIETSCSNPELHRRRLEDRHRELPHLAEPDWHAVEQRLDEWQEWSGDAAAVPRLELDTVRPLDELVADALRFLRVS